MGGGIYAEESMENLNNNRKIEKMLESPLGKADPAHQ